MFVTSLCDFGYAIHQKAAATGPVAHYHFLSPLVLALSMVGLLSWDNDPLFQLDNHPSPEIMTRPHPSPEIMFQLARKPDNDPLFPVGCDPALLLVCANNGFRLEVMMLLHVNVRTMSAGVYGIME